jgi:hypothetical protein
LFINLAIKKILCVGLASHNRLVQFDAAKFCKEEQVNIYDIDEQYLDDFFALDHANFIEDFKFNLQVLGENLTKLDELNFNPEIVSSEANSNGLFEIRDGKRCVNKDELDLLNSNYELYIQRIEETIETIQVFFPDIDPSDLNSD